ncbi:MAG: DUF1697 domain-containing protein [Myxococcales bacterium]|nr:DUF1697 domain-containing protein [Myxococcales bacterium]
MRAVAFFRNLNLGRGTCPSKSQLEQAFIDGGALEATSFLTNGTVVFVGRARSTPERVLARARQRLRANSGFNEPGFVRTLDSLAHLLTVDPFVDVDRDSVHECSVTFLHADARLPRARPGSTPRGDVEVLRFTKTEVFCVSRVVGKSPGSPNAFLEKLLGLPATTRNWNTIVRVVRKFG